jgi:hypothetical protein
MKKSSLPTLIILAVMYTIHKLALNDHWYVRYTGLDIFMHILGGAAIALSINLALALFFPRFNSTFWTLMLFTFAAGLFWEFFEGINGIAGDEVGTTGYYLDTAKDLVNDMLGAIIAAFFLKK